MKYLFWANFFIWLGIGGYLSFLVFKTNKLFQRIRELENSLKSKDEN